MTKPRRPVTIHYEALAGLRRFCRSRAWESDSKYFRTMLALELARETMREKAKVTLPKLKWMAEE